MEKSMQRQPNCIDWDREFDIVVIGSGFAGLAAAIESRNAGASVLLLEKRTSCGGNSIMSDGNLAAAGSILQQEQGIKDSPELMYEDMRKAGLNLNDPTLVKIVTENSNETLHWLIDDLGVKFKKRIDRLGGHSAPRTFSTYNSSGTAIIKPLLAKARELGIEIKVQGCLQKIIQDSNDAVIGVKIGDRQNRGNIKFIKAKKGVILATGGFAGDVSFRTEQDPRLTEDVGNTNRSESTAEALQEAIAIGAQLTDIQWIQLGAWSSPDETRDKIGSEFFYTIFPYGVMLHPVTGKRFVNELADRKIRSDAILNVGRPCIGIADAQGTRTSGRSVDKYLNKGVIKKFNSLAEVAIAYDLPEAAIIETINCYNKSVEQKKDEALQKPILLDAKPLQPPYYGIRLWPKVHYTMGGIKIDSLARVVDVNSRPIKRLYAAGEVTGGIHGASRLGSCAITECLIFGRIAGKNAAREVPSLDVINEFEAGKNTIALQSGTPIF